MKKVMIVVLLLLAVLCFMACERADRGDDANIVDGQSPTAPSAPGETIPSKYTLRFVANGKELSRAQLEPGESITVPKHSKAGCRYVWNLSVPATMPAKDLTLTAVAEEGDLTSSVKWSYNFVDTLKIYGNGEIYNFSDENTQPWKEYKEEIKYLKIESGITAIGQFTFFGLAHIQKVTIPDTVKTIGSYSFALCDRIEELVIGSSVKHIGKQAFASSANLSRVEFRGATVWYVRVDNYYGNSFTATKNASRNADLFREYKGGEFSAIKDVFPYI